MSSGVELELEDTRHDARLLSGDSGAHSPSQRSANRRHVRDDEEVANDIEGGGGGRGAAHADSGERQGFMRLSDVAFSPRHDPSQPHSPVIVPPAAAAAALGNGSGQSGRRLIFGRYPVEWAFYAIGGIFVVIIIVSLIAYKGGYDWGGGGSSGGSKDGGGGYASLAECLAKNRPRDFSVKQTQTDGAPPSPSRPTPPSVLFQHASIWTGDGPLLKDADLLIQQGHIVAISESSGVRLTPPSDPSLIVYDASNRFITPGLVDLHSHAGLASWPEDIWANDDVNEMTSPTFPQLRAVDALDPRDPAFLLILQGGVTTSQIMPGSGDTMGGEGALVKHRGRTVQEMLIPSAPRLMKMACGENPKRVFGRKGVTPMSRLGSAWVMRQRFEQAAQLVQKQDAWCQSSTEKQSSTPFPNDRQHESLASLLRGEVRLNTHCYVTHDFEMILRLAAEFNFNITTFHHALGAWRVAELFKYYNISVATFADLGLYKKEAYDASVRNVKILHEAGVNTILKSDHPVTFSGAIMWEAAKAHHYGLPAEAAIASITSAPARAAGLDHRLGFLRPDYDADIVVWDRDPLLLGAQPMSVFIEGERVVDVDRPVVGGDSTAINPEMTSEGSATVCGLYNDSKTVENDEYRTVGLDCYAIVDVEIYQPSRIPAGTIVVENGIVSCIGSTTDCPEDSLPSGCQIFRNTNGIVVPGFIEAGVRTGLYDIESEDVTGDGTIPGGEPGTDGGWGVTKMSDGLRFQGRHVRASWAGGVTMTVVRPRASQVIAGQSTLIRTCCGPTLLGTSMDNSDGSLLPSAWNTSTVAFHIVIGETARNGGKSSTVSGQIASLRAMFGQAKQRIDQAATSSNISLPNEWEVLYPFVQVLQRKIPLAAEVYHADHMVALMRLQASFGFKMIFVGAAESHLVASALAAATPPIGVLYFSRPLPASFERLRLRRDAVKVLRDAGVVVALSTGDTDNARNLRWEAGWNKDWAQMTDEQTVQTVTTNVRDLFNLPSGSGRIVQGERAELVLYNGSPFSLQSYVQLVTTGRQVDCKPQQR